MSCRVTAGRGNALTCGTVHRSSSAVACRRGVIGPLMDTRLGRPDNSPRGLPRAGSDLALIVDVGCLSVVVWGEENQARLMFDAQERSGSWPGLTY